MAHTKGTAIAISANIDEFKGVGCDIESELRPIADGADHHFINEHDNCSYSSLEKWCIKEACFKALSNSGYDVSLLKEVVIDGDNFFLMSSQKDYQLNEFQVLKRDGHFIVFAYCKKKLNAINLVECK